MRILLASPAYWPAHAFGGPVVVARELVSRLAARGHHVEVVTTTLIDVDRRPGRRTRVETVDGARVTYLATPVRYRWMGITPTLPLELRRLARPDVAHVMGFRDPVTTGVAAWCRPRRVPYVFEPVGMFAPRLRKVALKRLFDSTLTRGVASGARLVVVSSPKERDDVVAAGADPQRVRIRTNAFPEPPPRGGRRSARGRRARGRAGRPLRRPDRGGEGHRAPPGGCAQAARRPRRPRRPGRPARHAVARRSGAGRSSHGRPRAPPSAHARPSVRSLSARRRVRPRLGRRELRARRRRGRVRRARR